MSENINEISDKLSYFLKQKMLMLSEDLEDTSRLTNDKNIKNLYDLNK
jgi:hypothetical protein